MLSVSTDFGFALESFLVDLLSTVDPDAMKYKLNDLEDTLLSTIATLNEDILRPIVNTFIQNVVNVYAVYLLPRDLHITNDSFITDPFSSPAQILPPYIGGAVPSKYNNVKMHSIGVCGNGANLTLQYLDNLGNVELSSEFDLQYSPPDWTAIDPPNDGGYVHQWKWISAFECVTSLTPFANKGIYRSAEIHIRELQPTVSYAGVCLQIDGSPLASGDVMHDIGFLYDAPYGETGIEQRY